MMGLAAAWQTQAIDIPLSLGSGRGGVNVTWTFKANASAYYNFSSPITLPILCPANVSHVSVNLGYTWMNQTIEDYECGAIAEAVIYAETYLVDSTNNTTFIARNPWHSIGADAEIYNQTIVTIRHYSNPAYWHKNSTSYYYDNFSRGAPGFQSISISPEWFINGTFVASHTYELITNVSAVEFSQFLSYIPGYATAKLDMTSSSFHEKLHAVQTW